MKIPREYEDARLNLRRTAELLTMHEGHLRRLVRRGVFPKPKRTAKGLPYFDFELLTMIAGILQRGVGVSGEEVSFYRRKPQSQQRTRRDGRLSRAGSGDAYIASIIQGCGHASLALGFVLSA